MEEIRRRTPAPFLSEGEKETTWRERTTNGYGELELPVPVLIPTRSNWRGSTAYHRGSTARAEVRAEAVVPLNQAAVKNYCRAGAIVPFSPNAVVP